MNLTNEYTNLISNIKYFRKKLNITQEELAEKADLSVSYIKQIEAGKEFKNITFITASKIANALNIDVKELFEDKILV